MKSPLPAFALLLFNLTSLSGCYSDPSGLDLARPTEAALTLLKGTPKAKASATAPPMVTALPTTTATVGAPTGSETSTTVAAMPPAQSSSPTVALTTSHSSSPSPAKTAVTGDAEASANAAKPTTADVNNGPEPIEGATLAAMGLKQTGTAKGQANGGEKKPLTSPADGSVKGKGKTSTAVVHQLRSLWTHAKTGALVCPPSVANWCESVLRRTDLHFKRTAKHSIVCRKKDATACLAALQREAKR